MPGENPAPLILLVDDYPDASEMYATYLEMQGYRAVTASSGEQSLRIASLPDRPSLILMDIQMPGMGGTKAMQALKQNPALAAVPIVAFTAHVLDNERHTALRSGFDAFIAKPCLPDQLVKLVHDLLEGRGVDEQTGGATTGASGPTDE